ncbi:MAG TPA: TlpA disulfide reductase family protein [Promineifilum sp.]
MPKRLVWVGLLIVTGLLGTIWIFHSRETAAGPMDLATAPHVGSLAPDFTLQTPSGTSFTLSDYAAGSETPVVGTTGTPVVGTTGTPVVGTTGTPVVLNFWATWCPPCRIEMPFFDEVARRYGDKVAVLGLNQAESAAVIEGFARENNLTYTLLVDHDLRVNNLYGVLNLPTTIFIDKNGIVREVLIGTISQAVLEDRIDTLLDY